MSLPALLRPESFPGADYVEKWHAYIEAIYDLFVKQVAHARLQFQGLPVQCRYQPPYKGKHFSFWHLITEGKVEDDRTPDLERCARISWIPWVIRNGDNPEVIRWWENERTTKRGLMIHTPLWFFGEDYAVILEKRPAFYLLITAYCLSPHQRKTFEKEWTAWEAKKAETA